MKNLGMNEAGLYIAEEFVSFSKAMQKQISETIPDDVDSLSEREVDLIVIAKTMVHVYDTLNFCMMKSAGDVVTDEESMWKLYRDELAKDNIYEGVKFNVG